MKFLIIFCCIFSALGGLLEVVRAVAAWRSEAENAHSFAALVAGHAVFDFLSFAAFLYLWRNDIVSERLVFFAVLPFIAAYTMIFRFLERKLSTGKLSL